MWNLQKLKVIRSVLTEDVCKTLVGALVMSHQDYANVILTGIPEVDIQKMQQVQNMAAKLVPNCPKQKVSQGVLEVFIGYQSVQESSINCWQ